MNGPTCSEDVMERYPVFLTFKEMIAGKKFLAGIVGRMRAVVVKEDSQHWFYGVNPGGIAQGGASLDEAQFRFRDSFKKVLQEIAQDAASFEDFKTEVSKFIEETDEAEEKDWLEARQAIREGNIKPGEQFSNLPRVEQDLAQFEIVLLEPSEITVESNEEYSLGRAA